MISSANHPTIALPITQTDRQTARTFAQEQPTPAKAEQVYLNTLAVLVVQHYLDLLEIPTNLANSYSWSPMGRLCANIADLDLPPWGRLECRPLRESERQCLIPPEVWSDRIGYVVVQLDRDCRQGTVLGFSAIAAPHLSLAQLAPLDQLLQTLHQTTPVAASPQVRLTQWFDQVFEQGWQTITELLNPAQLSPAFRSRTPEPQPAAFTVRSIDVHRAKLIDLGVNLGQTAVVLLVELHPEADDRINVHLRVYPANGNLYLPAGVQLVLLDATGEMASTVIAREADNYLQLRLIGQPGEAFAVTLALNQVSVTEQFRI
ncbi:MAG TPA: DUF1822 family protein [Microcoleaceae cyanobacterium]|jgi:hypothetical protein